MSTRSQIKVISNGIEIHFYHHYDGYFSGVGEEISNALLKFKKGILKKESWIANDFVSELLKYGGYEITFVPHGDIEFFYSLDFDHLEFKGYRVAYSNMWADSKDHIGRWKNHMSPIQSDEHPEMVQLLK